MEAVFVHFEKLSDLIGPLHRQGQEGSVALTVEPADGRGASVLGRAGPFPMVAQAGGHLHKAICHGTQVRVQGQALIRVFAWYIAPGTMSASQEIGQTAPIDVSARPSVEYVSTLTAETGGRAGRIYMSHRRVEIGDDGRPLASSSQLGACLAGPRLLSTSASTLGGWPQDVVQHLETPQDPKQGL